MIYGFGVSVKVVVKFEKERKVPHDHATNTSLLLHYVGFGIWNVRT